MRTREGEFPEIERRMAVAKRVQGVRRALPLADRLPSRVVAFAVTLTYRAELLWHRMTPGGS